MKIAVTGLGHTGSHVVRQLRGNDGVTALLLHDRNKRRQQLVADVVDRAVDVVVGPLAVSQSPDVVILAGPRNTHYTTAADYIAAGISVISVSDNPNDVDQLLGLHDLAVSNGCSVVVGAGFAPGLSCLLVNYGAEQLDSVESISVAKAGTGGPACARQHHWAMSRSGMEWVNNEWELRRGGSGRDLIWFPDPVGARDCYRAALPSPVLLQRTFTDTARISARMAANRRDRLTARLPMLRPPHAQGSPGAIRVELRGRRNTKVESLIYGVMDDPAVVAGTTAAVCAVKIVDGHAPFGAFGLSSWPKPSEFLHELHRRGVRVASFDGYLQTNA